MYFIFFNHLTNNLFFLFSVTDDRRRGGRREDPRRHTLGGDMLGYTHQGQVPLQRAMDLEVHNNYKKHYRNAH